MQSPKDVKHVQRAGTYIRNCFAFFRARTLWCIYTLKFGAALNLHTVIPHRLNTCGFLTKVKVAYHLISKTKYVSQ